MAADTIRHVRSTINAAVDFQPISWQTFITLNPLIFFNASKAIRIDILACLTYVFIAE